MDASVGSGRDVMTEDHRPSLVQIATANFELREAFKAAVARLDFARLMDAQRLGFVGGIAELDAKHGVPEVIANARAAIKKTEAAL